jgi:uncharacterized membrane protein
MRRVILALIVGAAVGYNWGYTEGTIGRPSIVTRVMDKFGASKVRDAQTAREQRVQDASKP